MKSRLYLHACCIFALCTLPFLLTGQTAGTPDPNFGQAGQAFVEDPLKTYFGGPMVLLPDGKLIVMAYEYDQNGENGIPVLNRFLPDGTPDPGYGVDGRVYPDINTGFDGGIYDIALTADGKLIAAGVILTDTSSTAFAARLDTLGELDESFGQNGLALFDIGSEDDDFLSVLIKPDGKILLGGDTYDADNPGFFDLLLVQLLPDGSPDPAFGTVGIATADFAAGLEAVLSLSLQADGKIVAVGGNLVTNYDMEIARFLPDGAIDSSFANNGVLIFGVPGRDDVAYSGAVQPDQKIVFCGTSFQNSSTAGEMTLFRLNTDGSFDATFDTDGKVFTDLGVLDFARAVILQPDGKILVGAESVVSTNTFEGPLWVLRYNSDGTLDDTFGNGGKAQSPPYADPEDSDLLLQPDGKIVQTGTADGKIIIRRYLNDITIGVDEISGFDFQLQCSPNPVAGSAQLSWIMLEPNEVCCDLYDVRGGLIKNLLPRTVFPAGAQRQVLNFGNDIPQGVYFLALQVGNAQQILKVIRGN